MASLPTAIRYSMSIARWGSGIEGLYFVSGEDDVQVMWTGDYELRKLTVDWTRVFGTDPVQDVAECTFHFLNITSDSPDSTWTDTDYGQVETAFDNFWSAIDVYFPDETVLSKYTFRKDGPGYRPFGTGFAPVERATARSAPGDTTSTEGLPPQVAITVTEVTEAQYTAYGVGVPGSAPGTGTTQVRNRWGRYYLPAPTISAVVKGRIAASAATALAAAAQAFYNECVSHDIVPVMYSPSTGNAWSVTDVHVDDIFDVIRSRRFTTPKARNSLPINPL